MAGLCPVGPFRPGLPSRAAMAEWCAKSVRSAPLGWLVRRTVKPIRTLLIMFGIGVMVAFVRNQRNSVEHDVICAVVMIADFAGAFLCWRASGSPHFFEAMVWVLFSTNSVGFALMGVTSNRDEVHLGWHLGATVGILQVTAAPFMRLPAFLPFLVVSTAGGMFSAAQTGIKLAGFVDDNLLTFIPIISVCIVPIARVFQSWLVVLHDIQENLQLEKDAVESLLLMVCDTTFWLSSDADSIVRCDGRLEMLMGKRMRGRLLSQSILQTEQEQQRLQAAIAPLLASSASCVPLAFHTTLVTASGNRQKVQLLIVDRRRAMVDAPAHGPGMHRQRS